MKPLKEVEKKIASLQNLTTKKMNSGSSLYHDGYGSYDFPKKCPFHETS